MLTSPQHEPETGVQNGDGDPLISVVIIAKDEASRIGASIESVVAVSL